VLGILGSSCLLHLSDSLRLTCSTMHVLLSDAAHDVSQMLSCCIGATMYVLCGRFSDSLIY